MAMITVIDGIRVQPIVEKVNNGEQGGVLMQIALGLRTPNIKIVSAHPVLGVLGQVGQLVTQPAEHQCNTEVEHVPLIMDVLVLHLRRGIATITPDVLGVLGQVGRPALNLVEQERNKEVGYVPSRANVKVLLLRRGSVIPTLVAAREMKIVQATASRWGIRI